MILIGMQKKNVGMIYHGIGINHHIGLIIINGLICDLLKEYRVQQLKQMVLKPTLNSLVLLLDLFFKNKIINSIKRKYKLDTVKLYYLCQLILAQ